MQGSLNVLRGSVVLGSVVGSTIGLVAYSCEYLPNKLYSLQAAIPSSVSQTVASELLTLSTSTNPFLTNDEYTPLICVVPEILQRSVPCQIFSPKPSAYSELLIPSNTCFSSSVNVMLFMLSCFTVLFNEVMNSFCFLV